MGLDRAVKALQIKGLKIGQLVTDRHVSIVKYAREQMKGTLHTVDVWHVAKSMCALVCVYFPVVFKLKNHYFRINNVYTFIILMLLVCVCVFG